MQAAMNNARRKSMDETSAFPGLIIQSIGRFVPYNNLPNTSGRRQIARILPRRGSSSRALSLDGVNRCLPQF
jgi:hypothetical protein